MSGRGRGVADLEAAAAAREETLARMHEQLADQVERLASGEGWRAWLSFASGFHRYSFNNSLLIMAQAPHATLVAGYRAWQAKGRQVRRGETGIRVFGPVTKRLPKEDASGGPVLGPDGKPELAIRVVGVRPLSVFDVSQTDGEPLPEVPRARLLAGDAPVGLWEALRTGVEAEGFSVSRGDCGGANGLTIFDARQVRVRADVDDAQAVKTLAHEWAHVVLHRPGERDPFACRGVVEVEAESVAYLVMGAHSLDASQYTFNYVAGWAQEAARPEGPTVSEVLRQTADRVVRAARTILDRTLPDPVDPNDPTQASPVVAAGPVAAEAPVPAWELVSPRPPVTLAGPSRVPIRLAAPVASAGWGDVGGRGIV